MISGNSAFNLASVPAVVRRLSLVLAALICLLPPIGYWLVSYQHKADQLLQSAELIAHAISKIAYLYPNEWDLQIARVQHIVGEFRPLNSEIDILIMDSAGHYLIQPEQQQRTLAYSSEAFILDGKGVVGNVILRAGLVDVAYVSASIGLFGLLLALGFLGTISRYSIRGIHRAMSEIEHAQHELWQQQMYLEGILSSSEQVAIVATDRELVIQYFNQAAERLFGCPSSDALGGPLNELHNELQKNISNVQQFRQGIGNTSDCEFAFSQETNGLTRHIEARISTIVYSQHGLSGYTLMCTDVTEQHNMAELVKHQAMYDSLTNLPNRRLFKDQLGNALARGKRHGHLGAVLFLDLDNFKHVNDSLGHSVGDALLRGVATRMKSCLREEDTVARLGGDEFLVLLPEVSDDPDGAIKIVQELAEKVRKTLSLPYVIEPHTLHVTLSIGISVFPNGKEGLEDVMQQADTAMYRAKEAGRNTLKFFLPNMQYAAEARLKVLCDLRQGIDRSEFMLFFQPQFNAGRKMIGAEALIRWQHPDRGVVQPLEFIPLAEESGLILDLGDFVLESALVTLCTWLTAGLVSPLFCISVNISPQQFKQADFVHRIEYALGDAGVEPENLALEITEGVLLEDINSAVEKILALKKIGVRFSIDDFGTGYSSLAYLKRLPVNEVKIDRSFVRDVLLDDSDAALVEAIVNLASRLSLETVAEGVETEEQYEYLKQLGCKAYQGYHFSKPLSQEEFLSSLMDQKQISAAGMTG